VAPNRFFSGAYGIDFVRLPVSRRHVRAPLSREALRRKARRREIQFRSDENHPTVNLVFCKTKAPSGARQKT
jgi:hypothetical protein